MSLDSTATRRRTDSTERPPAERTAVSTILPWVIAAAAVVLYGATRDPWQSLAGAQTVNLVSGWSFQPDLTHPLYWLVTLPFRLLPAAWIPAALNLFSAACGALTLALLARSVALLPHDRTEQQRLRERSPFSFLTIRSAWLPPVVAALGCGLQLSFWEHATAISSEIFDLLLFAYVIRCVLEYRRAGADSWLLRAGFVYAAAMTGNWAMLAFAPVFIAALIWNKGLGFFEARFLGRLIFLGSLGLCFYLLLPAVASLSADVPTTFWQALKANLGHQKNHLVTFVFNKGLLLGGERPLWVLALPSLLPVLLLSIRWPSYFGDRSRAGSALATWTFNFLYAIFFCFCAWVLLDPQFSPRNYLPDLSAYMTYLPSYYLTALSLGYFCGYFLLVFGGAKPVQRFPRPEPAYVPLLNASVTVAVFGISLFLPVMLIYANAGRIGRTGPVFHRYAQEKTQGVPSGAVVLADNPVDVLLVNQLWTAQGVRKNFLVLDTQSLTRPAYHKFLARRQPGMWQPELAGAPAELSGTELTAVMLKAAAARPIYYLHPSFGYYFESFYGTPDGLRLKLEPCGTNTFLQPPLTAGQISANQAFWAETQAQLDAIVAAAQPYKWVRAPAVLARLAAELGLVRTSSRELQALALSYSRALDFWGVQLQRNGKLPEAQYCFETALKLTPESFSADLNLACNRNLQAGRPPEVSLGSGTPLLEKAQRRGNIQTVLNLDGPVDEPLACSDAGQVFYQGRNFRQAAQEFRRVADLLPNDLSSRILLAQTMVMHGRGNDALKIMEQIHSRETEFGVNQTNAPQVLETELAAHLANQDEPGADKAVETALSRYRGADSLLAIASHVYLSTGHSSNALAMLDRELKLRPDDTGALVNLGVAWIRLTNYDKALPPLTRVVQMGTNHSADMYYRALFNRALAYSRSDKLDSAQRDLQEMQQAFPGAPAVTLSLAEIGYRRKDTNLAIRNYELFLQTAATNTAEGVTAIARLKELKHGKR